MRNIALIVIAFCCVMASYAQEQKAKPKIGLVLSGGGAKGFAHIGVLKAIEEAGVEISYIGGTSMGAVIGGLYASGYNARQIDSVFKCTDFDQLLKDYIPRSSKNFFEKRNDEMYALSLPFNKFKIGIPTAYSKGLYNYNLLAKLCNPVRHVRDFNKLKIPFLCIATDIETGEEVLLNSGYLPQAMQASAAFPSLFSPVEIDGRWLVDGGVTNNYPIDEVKKMGADIIIGVDVQDGLKTRKSLKDATRILVQISNLQMIDKMKDKIKKTDVYIKPDITDFTVISFDDGSSIIKKGEEAANRVIDQLREIGSIPKYENPGIVKQSDSISINKIIMTRLDNYTRAYVIGKLRFRSESRISYEDLKTGINNLSATQNFSAISYSLEKNSSNNDDLNINLTENKTKTYLKFGLHYDGLYKSGILINFTNKNTLFKNDVASLDMILGDNLRYNFDYYIDNGFYWSFGFKSQYNQFNRNAFFDFSDGFVLGQLNLNSLNIDFSDFTNQAYLQTIFAQKFLIGAGLEYKALKIKSATLQNTSGVLENSDYTSVFGYFKFDSLDDIYFPNKGYYFYGNIQSFLYSTDYTKEFEPYSIAKGSLGFAKTLFNRATFRLDSEAGFVIGDHSVDFFNFTLGGFGFNEIDNIKPFYGYDFLSINGDSFIKSTFTVDYEFFKKHHLNFAANYAQIKDNLFENTENWLTKPKFSGYAVGYALETIIGPAEIKYSWSPEMQKGFTWFSVGFWF